jgi:hypothetical protein
MLMEKDNFFNAFDHVLVLIKNFKLSLNSVIKFKEQFTDFSLLFILFCN